MSNVCMIVASFLTKGFNSEERRWRRELGCKIKINAVESLHFLEFRIYNEQGDELQRKRY